MTGGQQGPGVRALDNVSLLSGSIDDFTSQWYLEVGSAITVTMAVNVWTLNIPVAKAFVKAKLARCLDRSCTLNMGLTKQKLQVQLENLYTGPQFLLEERYASLLVVHFVSLLFSGGMPSLWLVAAASFTVSFVVRNRERGYVIEIYSF